MLMLMLMLLRKGQDSDQAASYLGVIRSTIL